MTDTKPVRPILHARMPLKNFKFIGELTEADSEWWHSFGRHFAAAQRNFPKPPKRWPE